MYRMRRAAVIGAVVGVLSVVGVFTGEQQTPPVAGAPSRATVMPTVVLRNPQTATAAQRNAEWQPTYQAELTCNHAKPPAVARVVLPDVVGMTHAAARCALIRAGVRAPIDAVGVGGALPAEMRQVPEDRVLMVIRVGERDGFFHNRLMPGTVIAPDASLAIAVYTPHG